MKLKLLFLGLAAIVAVKTQAQQSDEINQVKQVLELYKQAIESLDTTGTGNLFVSQSIVIESGKVEGRYQDYLANHLGPELHHFESFKFSDYEVAIEVALPFAFATETYKYTIVLSKDKSVIERKGVASSILKKENGQWKIWQTHSSARKPQTNH
jgi:ketosteroid isomerase-like protein